MALSDFLSRFLSSYSGQPGRSAPQQQSAPGMASTLGFPSQQPQMPLGFGGQQPSMPQAQASLYPNDPNSLPPVNQNWLKQSADAAEAAVRAKQPEERGLVNILTGRDIAAARQAATINGPTDYYKQLTAPLTYQQADTSTKEGQLNFLQGLTRADLISGQNINPNNIMGGLGGYLSALRGQYGNPGVAAPAGNAPPAPNGTPQAPSLADTMGAPPALAPTAPNQPQASSLAQAMGAPAALAPANAPAPNPQAPPGVNPAFLQQRQAFERMGQLYGLTGDPKSALGYFGLNRQGLEPGQNIDPQTGATIDAGNGAPLGMSSQDYSAQGAGKVATAQQTPKTAGEEEINSKRIAGEEGARLTEQGQQAGLQRETNRQYLGGQLSNQIAGQTFGTQREELKALADQANSADSGLQLGQQIFNAANDIYTGTGADTIQDFRKLAQGAATAAGIQLPASWNESTSKFEQLKFAAQQLVAVASHSLSPRVSQLIYQQIAAVKPGDATSVKGLRDILSNELFPVMLRQRAMLGATADYYQKNPTKLDAAAVVPAQLPIANFGVKDDLHKVQPGDYYIDPKTHQLDQR